MARWLDNFEPIGFPVADSNLPVAIARILASGFLPTHVLRPRGERPHIIMIPRFPRRRFERQAG